MNDSQMYRLSETGQSRRRAVMGFTLIEMIVAMAVMVILAAVAMPGFVAFIEDHRVSTRANGLMGSLNLARSEAIKRGQPASLSEEPGGFDEGWCVHIGAACAAATEVRREPADDGVTIATAETTVQFDARGARLAPAADAVFTVRPRTCKSGDERMLVLTVGLSGRVNMDRGVCP